MTKKEIEKIENALFVQLVSFSILDNYGRLFHSIYNLEHLKKILTKRDFNILVYKYGLEDGIFKSHETTGNNFKISRLRVGQILERIIKKIRKDQYEQ